MKGWLKDWSVSTNRAVTYELRDTKSNDVNMFSPTTICNNSDMWHSPGHNTEGSEEPWEAVVGGQLNK